MKRLLIAAILIILLFVPSQAKKIFVAMEYHKNNIKLDYGTNRKAEKLKDENGNELKFNSVVGALNYMSYLGWELLGSSSEVGDGYGYAVGGMVFTSSDSKTYYLFYKEVSDEELKTTIENGYKN